MPRIDIDRVPVDTGSNYPTAFRHVTDGRTRQALGDAAGLTQFGVRLTRLAPGAASALRHWHSSEDEFIYILEGTPTLITDAGEERLNSGDAAGFPAGDEDGHQLVNHSDAEVVYLEIGSRAAQDYVAYSDVDMQVLRAPGRSFFLTKSGLPYRE